MGTIDRAVLLPIARTNEKRSCPEIFACPSGYVIAGDDVKAVGKCWSHLLHRLARFVLLVGRHIRRCVHNVGSASLKK
jgi:hypothetical protein